MHLEYKLERKHNTINAHARSAIIAWTFSPHTQRKNPFS